LKNKPIRDLHEDQFLRIHQVCLETFFVDLASESPFFQADQDSLLTYEIHIDERDNSRLQNYYDEIKQLYIKDEFSKHVQEWNDLRCGAIERALNMILFPHMVKEVKTKLLEEAKDCIIKVQFY
jgi:transcription elongation factor SPT6